MLLPNILSEFIVVNFGRAYQDKKDMSAATMAAAENTKTNLNRL
jgi:hypothetical protein